MEHKLNCTPLYQIQSLKRLYTLHWSRMIKNYDHMSNVRPIGHSLEYYHSFKVSLQLGSFDSLIDSWINCSLHIDSSIPMCKNSYRICSVVLILANSSVLQYPEISLVPDMTLEMCGTICFIVNLVI